MMLREKKKLDRMLHQNGPISALSSLQDGYCIVIPLFSRKPTMSQNWLERNKGKWNCRSIIFQDVSCLNSFYEFSQLLSVLVLLAQIFRCGKKRREHDLLTCLLPKNPIPFSRPRFGTRNKLNSQNRETARARKFGPTLSVLRSSRVKMLLSLAFHTLTSRRPWAGAWMTWKRTPDSRTPIFSRSSRILRLSEVSNVLPATSTSSGFRAMRSEYWSSSLS